MVGNAAKVSLALPGYTQPFSGTAYTLTDYVNYVVTTIQNQQVPVILVSHSLSSVVAAAVAEQIPTLVLKLVFINSPIPQNGDSIQNLLDSSTLNQFLIDSDTYLQFNPTQLSQLETMYFSDCVQAGVAYDNQIYYFANFQSPILNDTILLTTSYGNIPKVAIMPALPDPISFRVDTFDTQTTVVQIPATNTHALPLCSPRLIARQIQTLLAETCPASATDTIGLAAGGRERGGVYTRGRARGV